MMRLHNANNPACDERGSTLVMYAILLSALFVALALGFGVVGAINIRTNQESMLSIVREQEMNPAQSLVTKNSTDPGMTIARNTVKVLRDCSFKDSIEVWFYEVPAHDLAPNRRIYAVEIALATPYHVAFGGAVDISLLNITSSATISAMPYAEFESWRPSSVRCGVFRAKENTSSITFESKALAAMPEGIRKEISDDMKPDTP